MPLPILMMASALAQAVPTIAGWLKGDKAEKTAQGVVDVAMQVTGLKEPQSAVDAILADPEQAAKFQTAVLEYRAKELEEGTKRLVAVNQTMREEQKSNDPWARRWRPFFGYMMACSWGLLFATVCFSIAVSVFTQPEHLVAVITAMKQLIAALVPLFSVAMAVLGVSVWKRSTDKKLAAGVPVAGPMSGIVDLVKTFKGG